MTSERLYRALLNLYPASFRAEYGAHMVQVFRDQRRDALRESGMLGLVRLWLHTVADLVLTIPKEHLEARKRRPAMPSSVIPKPPNQLERFTQRARRALTFAQEAAQNFQHSAIGPEHLLLGLLRESEGVAGHVLRDLGVQQARLEEVVRGLAKDASKSKTMNLAPSVKKALEAAVHEARSLGHNYVGTEHLLLGLLQHKDSPALVILKQLGLSEETIRKQTFTVLQQKPVKTWQHTISSIDLPLDVLDKYRLHVELTDKSPNGLKVEFSLSLSQFEQSRTAFAEKVARAVALGEDVYFEFDTPQGKHKWYGISLYEIEQYRKALFGPLALGEMSYIEIDTPHSRLKLTIEENEPEV